jgi:hypothetical protein
MHNHRIIHDHPFLVQLLHTHTVVARVAVLAGALDNCDERPIVLRMAIEENFVGELE